MSRPAEQYDVIVAGGGPAGACAAINLARGGVRVLLVEQKKFPREKLCGEFISPECLEHFARLGVLDAMTHAGGVGITETIFYTSGGRNVAVPSAWFGAGRNVALGLSRAEMDARLLDGARASCVEVLEETTVAGLLIDDGQVCGVRLSLSDGETRECGATLTIDATGRQRVLARYAERARGGGGTKQRAPLVAFKAHLENTRGADGVCEIYFYPGGYGGLNAVEGGLSNLCFIARARDVRARASDAGRVMREVLMKNSRAAETLSGAQARTPWLGVALESFGRGELIPAKGLLAVGDAASFIDPFTGSGMLMALESGEVAAESIINWLRGARAGRLDFAALARDYGARYAVRFDARLRLCSWLRRAAFAPPALAEVVVVALAASESFRRRVARATRTAKVRAEG